MIVDHNFCNFVPTAQIPKNREILPKKGGLRMGKRSFGPPKSGVPVPGPKSGPCRNFIPEKMVFFGGFPFLGCLFTPEIRDVPGTPEKKSRKKGPRARNLRPCEDILDPKKPRKSGVFREKWPFFRHFCKKAAHGILLENEVLKCTGVQLVCT